MLIMLMNVPFGQDKLAVKKWQVVELRSKKSKERHYDVYFLLRVNVSKNQRKITKLRTW